VKKRDREPPVPAERHETIRRQIMAFLQQRAVTALEISAAVRLPEREVYEHLEHIHMSLSRTGHPLVVIPSACRKCGFVFTKRDRMKRPGRCPVCRNEAIEDPLFSIEEGS
jgi:transcriptional regulator